MNPRETAGQGRSATSGYRNKLLCAHTARRRAFHLARLLVSLFLVVHLLSGTATAGDILTELVTNCLDITSVDYCSSCKWPRLEGGCPESRCESTTGVLRENNSYVVIRDNKMCSCGNDFIHALAMPRALVTGVESPIRPEGIWEFAWKFAIDGGYREEDIALAVNPRLRRSQNQLHVHIVRLRPGARKELALAPSEPVADLSAVWQTAKGVARRHRLEDYGVIVFKGAEGKFVIALDAENVEKKYTVYRCK